MMRSSLAYESANHVLWHARRISDLSKGDLLAIRNARYKPKSAYRLQADQGIVLWDCIQYQRYQTVNSDLI